MSRPDAKAVKASRDKAGVKSTSIYLTEDERARWKRIAKARGKTLGETLSAGLDLLEGRNDLTQEQVLDWIKRNT